MAYEGQFGAVLPEQIIASNSLDELGAVLFRAANHFGFPYIWCGAHADPFNIPQGAVLFQNYPAKWIGEYVGKRYYNLDPVFRAAEITRERFSWDDPVFLTGLGERQRRIINEARRYGIASGLTLSLNDPGCVAASCTLIPRDGDWSRDALTSMINVVWVVYGRGLLLSQTSRCTTQEARLSRRERDCLRLKARGATVVEIGAGLGIAGSTVRRHLDRAQVRLSARTREHAVALAIRQGQIS